MLRTGLPTVWGCEWKILWQWLNLDINISTEYVYVRKHTHNKNEKATEIMFCESNENEGVRV